MRNGKRQSTDYEIQRRATSPPAYAKSIGHRPERSKMEAMIENVGTAKKKLPISK